jgi:hypothetical protein
MLERLRSRVARWAGLGPIWPPPPVPSAAAAGRIRSALAEFRAGAPERYADLLLRGEAIRPTPAEAPRLAVLAEAGLVAPAEGGAADPCVRVFPFEGLWIATDLLARERTDQVFSLMFEQAYLVRHLGVRPGDAVLELCLGSGANALVAAGIARSVAGTEVNPRAAAFARCNAALNGRPLEVLEGSLFAPVGDRRFDLVLVNPPFEIVPPGEAWFLHSHGGADGMDVVRALLPGLPARLAPGGRFACISWSPASAEGSLLVDLVRAALPGHRLAVHHLDEGPLEDHAEPFAGRPGYDAWMADLRGRGFDRVRFLLVTAAPGEPGVDHLRPEADVAAARAVAAAWE